MQFTIDIVGYCQIYTIDIDGVYFSSSFPDEASAVAVQQ